jgi:IgA Peptidase M64
MKRCLHRTSLIILTIGLIGLATQSNSARQTPVQIYPTGGSTGGPILLVVLADRFTAAQEIDFNQAAANFINHGLFADPYYSTKGSSFTVKTIFQPWTPGTPSNYGFELGAGVTNCSIHWAPDTTARLEDAAGALNPFRILVVGNYTYNFGCTDDTWSYVAAGAVGQQVLQHEFGHLLAGLYDEFHTAEHVSHPHPEAPITRANCSTNPAAPHWGTGSTFSNAAGCDLYGSGIVHPTDSCRMGLHGQTFCQVCQGEMDAAIAESTPSADARPSLDNLRTTTAGFFSQQPTTPPANDNRSVRVLLEVNRETGSVSVKRATDATGPVRSQHQRTGDYVYEITDGGKPLSVGVIAGNPFETRSYRGGTSQHAAAETSTANILVTIPRETRQSLIRAGRNIEIAIYRLEAQAGNEPVTIDRLGDLKKRERVRPRARVSAKDFRAALEGTKPAAQR